MRVSVRKWPGAPSPTGHFPVSDLRVHGRCLQQSGAHRGGTMKRLTASGAMGLIHGALTALNDAGVNEFNMFEAAVPASVCDEFMARARSGC
jgi:hypothetical protein